MTELQAVELIEKINELSETVNQLLYFNQGIMYMMFVILGGIVALAFVSFLKKVI